MPRLKVHATVFGLYAILGVFLTWPLAFNLNAVFFNAHADYGGEFWGIWARAHGYWTSAGTALIAAPFGLHGMSSIAQPVLDETIVLLARLSSETIALNMVTWLAFPLAAFCTYVLLDSQLKDPIAAAVGGTIFGFCPASVAQVLVGHLAYAFNAFIPLLVLALFDNRKKRSMRSAVFVGVCFGLVSLTSLYMGYISLYILIFFLAGDLLSGRGTRSRSNIFLNYACCALWATIVVLPFEYRAVIEQLTQTQQHLILAGHSRPFANVIVYSTRPWDYLLPSIDHPMLGRFIENFIRKHLHGSNTGEQTLYLGAVPLSLFFVGLILAIKHKFSPRHRGYFLFYAAAAFWMCFISLPPYIPLGRFRIPLVSYFAYRIAPMFRVYSRFGILVNFFVACGAATTLAHLSGVMTRKRYLVMLAVLFPILIFEYWGVPPDSLSVSNPPEVYQWLAGIPGDFIIAEYPMMDNDEAAFTSYLFWQRIHGKRMVNGAGPAMGAAWDFSQKVKNPATPEALRTLKTAGVEYLIIHAQMYRDGPIPSPIKRHYPFLEASWQYDSGIPPPIQRFLKPYKRFGSDTVYKLGDYNDVL
jgi:hypothetical protein